MTGLAEKAAESQKDVHRLKQEKADSEERPTLDNLVASNIVPLQFGIGTVR